MTEEKSIARLCESSKVGKLIYDDNITIHWKRRHQVLQTEGNGQMVELQTSMKYEGYVNIQI